MKITLAAGADAARLLHDRTFRSQWHGLYERCPWATVFQTSTFLDPWFEIYGDAYRPLLVIGRRSEESLDGLLILVSANDSGDFAHAGTHHAEYQVWMAAPEDGNLFIERALDELARRFPKARLRFLYLPPSAPLDWAAPGGRWGACCEKVTIPVPLLPLDDSKLIDSLRKKRIRKWKMDALEAMGGLHLEEVSDADRFAAIFDEIIDFCDLRHGAVHDVLPFRRDARKKPLFLAMARVPGLMHISVLRAGGRLAAACICFHNRGRVLLGIITHSPFLAAYSLGALHVLILASRLAEQKIATDFDLSPGGGYKERFATRYEDSYVVIVSLDSTEAARRKRKRRIVEAARSAIAKARLEAPARFAVSALQHPAAQWGRLCGWLWGKAEVSLYALPAGRIDGLRQPETWRRDHLADLLKLRPAAFQAYLQTALSRLENSGHVYTWTKEGAPGCSIWTTGIQSRLTIPEVGQEIPLLPASAAVYGFHSAVPGAHLYEAALRAAIRQEFAGWPELRSVYTWIASGDRERQRVLQELGFVYAGAVSKIARAGRATLEALPPP